MNIRNSTDGQFAELMGIDATDHDARVMREMLVELGFEDTTDVPDGLWSDLLIAVAEATAAA
jgi:uncharacterized caspase-like protein